MGIINAIFQAIIQGLTEFLPVSRNSIMAQMKLIPADNMGYDKRTWRYDKGYFYRQVHS